MPRTCLDETDGCERAWGATAPQWLPFLRPVGPSRPRRPADRSTSSSFSPDRRTRRGSPFVLAGSPAIRDHRRVGINGLAAVGGGRSAYAPVVTSSLIDRSGRRVDRLGHSRPLSRKATRVQSAASPLRMALDAMVRYIQGINTVAHDARRLSSCPRSGPGATTGGASRQRLIRSARTGRRSTSWGSARQVIVSTSARNTSAS